MLRIIYISTVFLWLLILVKGLHDRCSRHGIAVDSWSIILFSILLSPLAVLSGLVTFTINYYRRFIK